VNLVNFNGKITDNKAELKWVTAEEHEELVYDVEKSFDGSNFTTIGTVSGSLTNGEPNNYSFNDPNELNGKAYYRLKIRSVDYRSTFSRIVQLSTVNEKFNFGAVVNPFNSTLYFDVNVVKSGPISAELVNQFGKAIRAKTLDAKEGNNQFFFENTGNLVPGIYILKIEMNGMFLYRKVIKSNN